MKNVIKLKRDSKISYPRVFCEVMQRPLHSLQDNFESFQPNSKGFGLNRVQKPINVEVQPKLWSLL